MDYTVSNSFLNKWKKKKEEEETLAPSDYGVSSASADEYTVSNEFINAWKTGTRLGKPDLEKYKEQNKRLEEQQKYERILQAVNYQPENGEALLAGMTPAQRLRHENVGGFVDTSVSWADKTSAVSRLILEGGDTDYAMTDKLLKQLKAEQERIDANSETFLDFAQATSKKTEIKGYINQLYNAKNRDVLSKTKMDGQKHSVLEELQIIAGLDGDEKERRKEAVLKKMEELGVNPENYALYTDDQNFNWSDFGNWAAYTALAGLDSFWMGLAKTADATLGNILEGIGWEDNIARQANEFYTGMYNEKKFNSDFYKERLGGGGGWQFASDALEGTTGAVPQMLMAIATAGGSATSASGNLATKAYTATASWLQKAGLTVSNMLKNPQFWMSFASSYGPDYEEAKEQGASETVATFGAMTTSLINAGIETGLDGGSGIQGLPDDLLSGNKNKVWAWVESSLEEGGEEMLQKFVSEIVTKAAYNHDADILNPEEYLREGAIGTVSGMALGGGQVAYNAGANAYNEYQANKLTTDEQTVVDKVTEMLIAEKEKDGNKLTNKEKKDAAKLAKIYVDKGYVKAETIESIFGGESYEAFRSELESFMNSDAYKAMKEAEKNELSLPELQKQYDELYKMENGKKSDEQADLQAELKKKIEAIKNSPTSADLKAQLDPEATRVRELLSKVRSEVYGKVKDSRLAESYRELNRRGEKFTVDVNKYTNEHARQTVQQILDSGLGDNTNQFHDTVEFLARMSADQGVSIDLTDTNGVKEAGHYMEGYITNGYVTADGKITLNYDSPTSLYTIAGHEITHVLEKVMSKESNAKFQQALFEFAKAKEGLERFNARMDAAREAYADKKNTTAEAEVAADLVGEYLFTDYEFIKTLARTDRNAFQRAWDRVKYMAKIAVAGSKEARLLEKSKHMFLQAYNEVIKGKAETKADAEAMSSKDVQHSLGKIVDENNHSYGIGVHLDSTLLDNLTPEERVGMVKEYVKELGGELFTAYDKSGNPVYVTIAKSGAKFKNQNGKRVFVNKDLKNKRINNEVKQEAIALIDELIVTAEFDTSKAPKYPHGWLDNNGKNDWEYWTTYIQDKNNTIWEATLNIANSANGEKILYDISPIKKVGRSINLDTIPTADSVAQNAPDVNTHFSLTKDSDGNDLTKAQQEYFKDSKMRDIDGSLKPMYHGSQKGGFHVFDPDYSDDDISLFFVDRNDVAMSYSGTSETYAAKTIRTAEDMNNFLAEIGYDHYEAVEKDGKFELLEDGDHVATSDTAQGIYEEFCWYEGIGDGNVNYKVYLNLTNPLVVDAKDNEWNELSNWSRAAFIKAEDVEVRRVGEDFRLFNKNNVEIEEAAIAVNPHNENIDTGILRSIMVDKVNSILSIKTESLTTTRDVAKWAKKNGYDGVIFNNIRDNGGYSNGSEGASTVAIAFDSNQIKSTANTNPTADPDIRYSLSKEGEQHPVYGNYPVNDNRVYDPLAEFAPVKDTEVAPVAEENTTTQETADKTEAVGEMFPDDNTSIEQEFDSLLQQKEALENRMTEALNAEDYDAFAVVNNEYNSLMTKLEELEALESERFDALDDADVPPVREYEWLDRADVVPLTKKAATDIARDVRQQLGLSNKQMYDVHMLIEEYSRSEFPDREQLFNEIKEKFGTYTESEFDETVKEAKSYLRTYGLFVSDSIKKEIADYAHLMRKNRGRIRFSKEGTDVDVLYHELNSQYPHLFPDDIFSPTDQFLQMVDVANMDAETKFEQELPDEVIWDVVDAVTNGVGEYRQTQREKAANKHSREAFNSLMQDADSYVPPLNLDQALRNRWKPMGTETPDAPVAEIYDTQHKKGVAEGQQAMWNDPVPEKVTKKDLQAKKVAEIDVALQEFGGLGEVLRKAKNLSTWATVDNTPQRVMQKSLGYKEGSVLADMTVNKVAQATTEGIKWLNTVTDRKDGMLAQLSKQYNIKPGSNEIKAAQMYAEGFYVNKNDEYVRYGDAELAKDFPDAQVRANIKGLVADPRIRQFYDKTLDSINESRVRNGYAPIPRLDNYYLHYRAQGDTFSLLGLPFNPNDIRAKDLPTDLNGVTADLKPGQPYFASAMHREGKRTTYDLFDGLERYARAAMAQIYYIDHIQTLRALRNYIADTYGQANGLEGLDALSEEEQQERIAQVYGSHLSTFAKFLNEEANVLAGKTALIDRGLEGILGRRAITFIHTVNSQTGKNLVGYSASSALVNFDAVPRAVARLNKADFVKAFGQFVLNRVSRRSDGFAENSPVIIRRKGADTFNRTLWQKLSDPGYVMMGAADGIATEIIARAKYNELTRKGMDSQKAHIETDKWVSALMGDRSLGQQPQLYNSKMLGLLTKFQLEVRNNLDSQFYDTIQEAKVSNEHIKNALARNAKTAAQATWTIFNLAVAQHLFGTVMQSVVGYNPTFDIIDVMIKAFGWDDDEDDEDTVADNIEEAFFALLDDLPYTSTFTGGRIPIESALPVEQLITGKDKYGNEKSRWEILGEAAPYYLLPGGYGQFKKTAAGLSMFDDDLPIAGSYTKPTEENPNGKLRFPVEDTIGNRIQAGLFGQYASENARYYFDNDIAPLGEKQIQEYIDVDIPIRDYWEYREGLKGKETLGEKLAYIDKLDLPIRKQNILANNLTDRKDPIDMADWDKYDGLEEYNYAKKYPEKYQFLEANGISVEEYNNFDDDTKEAYSWAYQNPEKYTLSKAVAKDLMTYRKYANDLNDIKADKDEDGKSISGSRKDKVIEYINSMNADYGEKIILFKSEYPADDTYNMEIVEYLNSREDISYEDEVTILRELGFTVLDNGTVLWD